LLRYDHLKNRPHDWLAATGLTETEFVRLLPAFETAYEDRAISRLKGQRDNHKREAA
jgi:hypothetical protein